jgi:hypothetical protein
MNRCPLGRNIDEEQYGAFSPPPPKAESAFASFFVNFWLCQSSSYSGCRDGLNDR